MADLLTVREALGGWDDKVVAWVGDGNNMANSWINAAGSSASSCVWPVPRGMSRTRRSWSATAPGRESPSQTNRKKRSTARM